MIAKLCCVLFVFSVLFFPGLVGAQPTGALGKTPLDQRVETAPESVFQMFRQAGMNPVNRPLTPAQQQKVKRAFAVLPPLHRRILAGHLQSISFMDSMPNTALTSILDTAGGNKKFNITFRAGLLDETVSQWATWKENTCFKPEENDGYQIRVEAGDMDALVYVLLHEATHVVDVVMKLTPDFTEKDAVVEPTPFTKDIWRLPNVPAEPYLDSLLETTRFRSGQPMAIRLAAEVYPKLAKTPFPSLYGMAAWSEDLAELASIYHMTAKLKQPFYIVVTNDHAELARFEPMKNPLVTGRLRQLAVFYGRQK